MKIREGMTVYTCEHCGKNYLRKKWALIHEHCCSRNPRNDSKCNHCKYDVNQYCSRLNKNWYTRAQKHYDVCFNLYEPYMIAKHECSKFLESELPF